MNKRNNCLIPIRLTGMQMEYNMHPIHTIGQATPTMHEQREMSIKGDFVSYPISFEDMLVLQKSMRGYTSGNLYLTSAHDVLDVLADVLEDVEGNLPKYLTSPNESERRIGCAIAKLRGRHNDNNKESKNLTREADSESQEGSFPKDE